MSNTTLDQSSDLPDTPGIRLQTATLGINELTYEQMKALLLTYASRASMFSLVLVKENGQGYNAVLHHGPQPKVRLALVDRGTISSTWIVRDLVEQLFANGQFTPHIESVVNRALQGLDGSVMLKIAQVNAGGEIVRHDYSIAGGGRQTSTPVGFTITKAVWHEDNIWP